MLRTLGILLAISLVLRADDPGILNLKVIEGDSAVYPVGSRATRGVTVLVSDESGRPVEGATVSFTLPSTGPGGEFASGGRTEIATTRADGRAAVWGMHWNRMPGDFELRVMAIKGQARAAVSAAQSLSDAPEAKAAGGRQRGGSGSHKVLWISLAAGAAAVAGIAGAGFAKSNTAPGTAAAASSAAGRTDRDANHHPGAAMKAFLLLVASVSALAQIERPQIGFMLDGNGYARAVLGVAGSATAAEPSWSGILSLACWRQVCFGKTQDALISSAGGPIDAPPGPVIFGFDGSAVYVYFTASRQLARWHDGRLDPVDFSPAGDVLALQAAGDGFTAAVRRADGAWAGGRYLGEATAVAFLDADSVVTADSEHVRLLRSDGTEADFAVAGVQALIRISDAYIQLVTSSGMWALAVEPGRERVFLLPGGSQ